MVTPDCTTTDALWGQHSGGLLYECCGLTSLTPSQGEVFAHHSQITQREEHGGLPN